MTGNLAIISITICVATFPFPNPSPTKPKPIHLVIQQRQEMKPIMQVASAVYHANKRLKIWSLHKPPRLVFVTSVCEMEIF